jgi:hypothetical protein
MFATVYVTVLNSMALFTYLDTLVFSRYRHEIL